MSTASEYTSTHTNRSSTPSSVLSFQTPILDDIIEVVRCRSDWKRDYDSLIFKIRIPHSVLKD